MTIRILLAALCFVLGLAAGIFTEHRFTPNEVFTCETIDYTQIEQIVARQVAAHPVQVQPPAFGGTGLDVEKIKHVRQFTYAPVFQVRDTCKGP